MYFICIIIFYCSVDEGFWLAVEEFQKYLKNDSKSSSILAYTLKIMMKFSPRVTLKVPILIIVIYLKEAFL